MSEQAMLKLKTDHQEIHARTFAQAKAREVSGVVVDMVLHRTGSTHMKRSVISEAEEHVERFLTALIKRCVIEFTDMYIRDQERRLERMQRLLEDAQNLHQGAMDAAKEGLI